MPGAGANVLSLNRLVRRLSDFHVVTIDPRGHGGSDEPEEATFTDFVDDVEAVIDNLGLGHPAVAGHSLGGMIAVAYGERHPECPGVVNIDGGFALDAEPSLYVDLSPDERRAFEEFIAAARAQAPPDESGDAVWLEAQIEKEIAQFGFSSPGFERFLRRNYARDADGVYHRRPSRRFITNLLDAHKDEGLAQYRRLSCPVLVFTTSSLPPNGPEVMRRWSSLRSAGLVMAQDEMRAAGLDFSVVHVDTTHQAVVSETAEQVADEIRAFLNR
jgi:pimeloyl-ACP methyl ester carboxylesterase